MPYIANVFSCEEEEENCGRVLPCRSVISDTGEMNFLTSVRHEIF
jgi:hypothetical protein